MRGDIHIPGLVEGDVVECHTQAVRLVEAFQGDFAGAFHAHVAEDDCGEGGELVVSRSGGGRIIRIHVDRVLGIADADVFVDYVAHQAAAGGIGFDADTVIGAIDGKVGDQDRARTAIGLAADGHAVAGIEMVVRDGHVGGGPGGAGLDGNLVVAGVDEAVGDGDVGGIPGVDAIGIAGGLGGVDDHAPGSEAVAAAVGDVEVG